MTEYALMDLQLPNKFRPSLVVLALSLATLPAQASYFPSVPWSDRDHDRDGLSNADELLIGTDYQNPDSDGDGHSDGWEQANGLDPKKYNFEDSLTQDLDSDNDGIPDGAEGDRIYDVDSDRDGLPDVIEVGMDDANFDGFIDDLSDTNNNGMPDVAEAQAVADSFPDFDGDTIPDYLDTDADNDGVLDHYEYQHGGIPKNFPGMPWDVDGDGFYNGNDLDADGDGKLDAEEFKPNVVGFNNDIDNDSIPNHLDADDEVAFVESVDALSENNIDSVVDPDGVDVGSGAIRNASHLNRLFWGMAVNANKESGSDSNIDSYVPDLPGDIDFDNDGILNEFEGDSMFDADSDDDGISDAIEIGLIDADNDGVLDDLSDTNNNGMPDVAEALAVTLEYPDFDGDGIPNHFDKDSDNDGLHDKLEYSLDWVPVGYGFYVNLLDIDGDGQPNFLDVDSDGDGVYDFDEQQLHTISIQRNEELKWYEYNSPTVNAFGQIHELADSDEDGIPNQADIGTREWGDSDGDGIKDEADIDRSRSVANPDNCQMYYMCSLEKVHDVDGDGIEVAYDWDRNSDGAFDYSSLDNFKYLHSSDLFPAVYNVGYPLANESIAVPAQKETEVTVEQTIDEQIETEESAGQIVDEQIDTEVEETVEQELAEQPSDLIENEIDEDELVVNQSSVDLGAASDGKSAGGALGFWTLLALLVFRRLSSKRGYRSR